MSETKNQILEVLASAVRMGQGMYPSPMAFAAALVQRLEHEGFSIHRNSELPPIVGELHATESPDIFKSG